MPMKKIMRMQMAMCGIAVMMDMFVDQVDLQEQLVVTQDSV
jgi:hypothetical protein